MIPVVDIYKFCDVIQKTDKKQDITIKTGSRSKKERFTIYEIGWNDEILKLLAKETDPFIIYDNTKLVVKECNF